MRMPNKIKTILAIETSCDETAAAVLEIQFSPHPTLSPKGRGGDKGWPKIKTLSSVIKSQIKLHSKFGGVVPEVAARAHVKNILPVVKKALFTAHYSLSTIDCITVTVGPGLIPSLLVGVEFAKSLAYATKKPIIPVNHMLGHLFSPLGKLQTTNLKLQTLFPMISLIVSGGHTILVLMENEKKYKVLGQTVDDAAGEAFDKVAKLLNLPYPGGPEVSKLAKSGNQHAINFPRPMIHHKNYNFSFSGLKTAVLYYLRDHHLQATTYKLQANMCASFQQAVIDVLLSKTLRAANEFRAKSISLSGGVSANFELRNQLRKMCGQNNLRLFVPDLALTTDNAEMIGIAAAFMLKNGFKPKKYSQIKTDSNLEL
jgi:N6-L-threonylcarbamoyladenine synthase